MTWDKTLPQGSTKLRNLGDVITPNWDAIETADSTFLPQALNLADRDALAIASDPTAIADAVIAYSKQDAAGNPQAYTIDPDSVITKLTGGTLTAANNGKLLLPNGLTLIWGSRAITSSWVVYAFPGGFTFTTACYSISGNAKGSTATIGFDTLTTTGFKAKASAGTPNITFMAIGK